MIEKFSGWRRVKTTFSVLIQCRWCGICASVIVLNCNEHRGSTREGEGKDLDVGQCFDPQINKAVDKMALRADAVSVLQEWYGSPEGDFHSRK